MTTILEWDASLLLWIQDNLRTPFLTEFFSRVTALGNHGTLWIMLGILLLVPKKTRKAGVLTLAALLGSLIINNMILKNLVARIRPYEVIDGLQLLIERQHDLSFPSGHAGSSFAAAVMMFLTLPKKYGIPALIVAGLIAISRLYVGVHYPTDVIVGVLTGTLIAIGIYKLQEWLAKRQRKRDLQ